MLTSKVRAKWHGLQWRLEESIAKLPIRRHFRQDANLLEPYSTVVVVGPSPGQAGGISSVMSYLEAETKDDESLRVVFLNTLRNERWSFPAFFRVVCQAAWIIMRSKAAARGLVFHLNVSTGGSTLRKWFISALCRATATPYVVHLHGSKYKRFYSESSPAVRRVTLQLFRGAHRIIVLGKAWHDYVVAELGAAEVRVVIVANGTPQLGDVKKAQLVAADKVRVIFSGRLSEQKGVPELLDAADLIYEKCQAFELVLMGDSRDEPLLTKARSKPYCTLTGWLSHDDVVKQLDSSDIFTLPSHDEGLPMAMIEAMSLAIPVVVTTVGSIEDVIENGEEGFLIKPGDVEALGSALLSLILNTELRHEMGKKAQLRWCNELEAGQMAQRIKLQWQTALAKA